MWILSYNLQLISVDSNGKKLKSNAIRNEYMISMALCCVVCTNKRNDGHIFNNSLLLFYNKMNIFPVMSKPMVKMIECRMLVMFLTLHTLNIHLHNTHLSACYAIQIPYLIQISLESSIFSLWKKNTEIKRNNKKYWRLST